MVLKRLFSRSTQKRKVQSLEPGQRVYAFGDIHGRLDLLEMLLERVFEDDEQRESATTTLVFLGDLVDRGPDSKGVVARLLALSEERPRSRFLMGNHDEVFLNAVTGDKKALRFLCRIGGKETILSYGLSEAEYLSLDYVELSHRLQSLVPREHIEFIRRFEDTFVCGDYLFVHAGIRPGVELAQQKAADLRWIRREFLDFSSPHSHVVVHGHSISGAPDIQKNRIGIDTGAFSSGRLTALGLQGSSHWVLEAQGEPDDRWSRLTD